MFYNGLSQRRTTIYFLMPAALAHDPHALSFDQKGIVRFTVPGGGLVGRVDPASGENKLHEQAGRPHGSSALGAGD